MSHRLAIACLASLAAPAQEPTSREPWHQPPFRVEAGGKPIEVDVGHAAPFVVDWDGDSVKDLLVGQFGPGGKEPEDGRGGRCRIYRNLGTDREREFGDFAWLMLPGGKPASMESA